MMPVFAAASDGAGAELTPVPGTAFERHELKDSLGRTVNYYISKPKQTPAPILLMIQGSGCVPIMNVQGSSAYSTMFNLLPLGQKGNFTVIAVEKPADTRVIERGPGLRESRLSLPGHSR